MQSQEISGSELGAIKYVSELLGWDVKRTANLFILILIFVFDPLAITLVIATNQAFKSIKKQLKNFEEEPKTHLQKEADRVWETVKKLKEDGIFTEPTEEELVNEPSALANSQYRNEYEIEENTDQVTTNNRPSNDQVNELFESDDYWFPEKENKKRLIYRKND